MPDVLFLRPAYEIATDYLSSWFGYGIAEAEKMGYRVIDLQGDGATYDNLVDALNTYKFSALFLGGHGSANIFTGQDGQTIFQACTNDQVLSGNIAYYLSCFVGIELGPSNVKKGLVSFLGYNVDFRFMVDNSYAIDKDPFAEPFRDIVVEVIVRILRGESMQNVWLGGIAKCDELIAKVHDRPEPQWSDVISFLEHDKNGFVALGNKEAYVLSPSPTMVGGAGASIVPIISGALLVFLGAR